MSTKKLTQEQFINKCKEIHDNKFSYENTVYINSITKISVTCNSCKNSWSVAPGNHIGPRKSGCPYCKKIKHQLKMRDTILTTDEFVLRSIEVHGNKFDYSKTKYVGSDTKVSISCPLHGVFDQWPQDHMNGIQCPGCSNRRRWSTTDFINEVNRISPALDLTDAHYINALTKISVRCEHGIFNALPAHLLNGGSCIKCGIDTMLSTKINKGIIRDPKYINEYELYRKQVWRITNKEFHTHYHKINPDNIRRGLLNHLDHKYSIQQGWQNNISADIIGSWVNLRLLPHKENRSKTNRCLYTKEELIDYYNLSLTATVVNIDNRVISTEELAKVPHKKRTEDQNKAQSVRQLGRKTNKHTHEANLAKSLRQKGIKHPEKMKPVICENITFQSTKHAAEYFSIDVTTVYNRINSDKFPTWIRIN